MSKSIVEIQGFDELNKKIKQLGDKVKKREMLKILRIATKPTIAAARSNTPVADRLSTRYKKKASGGGLIAVYEPGNLKKSIGNIVGKKGAGQQNAVIYVGPRSKGKKYDGWYGAMVHYGTKYFSGNPFMKKAYEQTQGQVTAKAEQKTIALIQKKINQLSSK